MEVKIRKVSKEAVFRIDEMAKSQNKSRSQFLKEQIELIGLAPQLARKDDNYIKILNLMASKLEQNEKIIKQVVSMIREMEKGESKK